MPQKSKDGKSFVEKIGNWECMVLNVIIARYLVQHGPISCIDTLVEILCDWRDTGHIQSRVSEVYYFVNRNGPMIG